MDRSPEVHKLRALHRGWVALIELGDRHCPVGLHDLDAVRLHVEQRWIADRSEAPEHLAEQVVVRRAQELGQEEGREAALPYVFLIIATLSQLAVPRNGSTAVGMRGAVPSARRAYSGGQSAEARTRAGENSGFGGSIPLTLSGGIVNAGRRTFDQPIYGRIPARQAVPFGTYSDTIVVTVVF